MKENENSNRGKAPHFLRRNWYWIVFITIPLLAAAILTAVPYGIDYAAEQYLMSHGVDVARVGDVDFNPFTGKLVLRDLRATVADAQVLHVPEATLRLHWRPLFNKRAHIEKLSIKDTTVIIDHNEKGRWRIGGLALAAAEAVAAKSTESAWGFTLNQLEIRNSQVEHLLGALKLKLTVDKATMSRLRSWDKEQAARLDFKGKINEASLKVQADFFPFATLPRVSGNLKLEALSLQDFAELAAPYLKGVQGELSINSSLVVKKENDRGISFSQDGAVSFRQIKVPRKGVDIAGRDMEWDGAIRIKTSGLSAQGKLKGTDLAVRSMEEGLDLHVGDFVWAGQVDYGKENQPGLLQAAGDLGLRHVNMDDMRRRLRLVGIGELSLKNISTQGPRGAR